jgi:Ca-activated chloride channel family protein
MKNWIGVKYFMFFVLMIMFSIVYAQSKTTLKDVRRGNSLYSDGKYKDAEIEYRKGIENSPDYEKAKFNLGTALYKQGRYEEAYNVFSQLTPPENNKEMAAKYWYNLGNSLLSQQKLQEGMEAFKNSLKLNPKDEDARYNFEWARRRVEQQQQQQQQQNNDKNDEQNKQDQQQQQQDKNKDQNKQQQRQQQREQRADERQLDALNQNERKTMEKLQKDKSSNKQRLEKDW